ncbi:MAG: hypothetical protein Q8K68_05435 [Nitrospirota bacterium]|nr:hypothetical protein [Nitrospirota bacterium]
MQGEIRRLFRNEIGFSLINKFTNSSTSPKSMKEAYTLMTMDDVITKHQMKELVLSV